VARITAPALVIHGEADVAIEPERARAMHARLPKAAPFARVPGGHAPNLTHPEPVNAAMLRFLEGLEP